MPNLWLIRALAKPSLVYYSLFQQQDREKYILVVIHPLMLCFPPSSTVSLEDLLYGDLKCSQFICLTYVYSFISNMFTVIRLNLRHRKKSTLVDVYDSLFVLLIQSLRIKKVIGLKPTLNEIFMILNNYLQAIFQIKGL